MKALAPPCAGASVRQKTTRLTPSALVLISFLWIVFPGVCCSDEHESALDYVETYVCEDPNAANFNTTGLPCSYRTVLHASDMIVYSMREACILLGYGADNIKSIRECYVEVLEGEMPVNITDTRGINCQDRSCFAPNRFSINSLSISSLQFDPAKDLFFFEVVSSVDFQDKRLYGLSFSDVDLLWRPKLAVNVVMARKAIPITGENLAGQCDLGWVESKIDLSAAVPKRNPDDPSKIYSLWESSSVLYPLEREADWDLVRSHVIEKRSLTARPGLAEAECTSNGSKFPFDSYIMCSSVSYEYPSLFEFFFEKGILPDELVDEIFVDDLVPWYNKISKRTSYIPDLLARSLQKITVSGFDIQVETFWAANQFTEVQMSPPEGLKALVICVQFKRRSSTYLLRFGLLVMLVTTLSLVTSWFHPSQAGVKLATCTVSLLTLSSTFANAASTKPSFVEFTLFDKLILLSMITVLIASGGAIVIYVAHANWGKRASSPFIWALNRFLRYVSIPLYGLVFHSNVIEAVGWSRAADIIVFILLLLALLVSCAVAVFPSWKVFKKMKRWIVVKATDMGFNVPLWMISSGDLNGGLRSPASRLDNANMDIGAGDRQGLPPPPKQSMYPFVPEFNLMQSATSRSRGGDSESDVAAVLPAAATLGLGQDSVRGAPSLFMQDFTNVPTTTVTSLVGRADLKGDDAEGGDGDDRGDDRGDDAGDIDASAGL